eukprot:6192027-Pleurochrysis_carterae.AAC.1
MVAESSVSEGDVMPPKAVSAALSRLATRWMSAVGSVSASGHEVSPRMRRKPARSPSGRDSVGRIGGLERREFGGVYVMKSEGGREETRGQQRRRSGRSKGGRGRLLIIG